MSDYRNEYTGSYLLVIGINKYSDPGFPMLDNAEADAQKIADVLTRFPYSFQMHPPLIGMDATKEAILEALYTLETAEPNDRIVIYFSGHGYTETDNFGHKVGYLACVDTISNRRYTALKMDDVTDLRAHTKAKHIAFIFDACFSGQALGLTKAASTTADQFMLRRAYQVLSAGASDQTVPDYDSMTNYLVTALSAPKSMITLETLGVYLKQEIADRSGGTQIPKYGHITGSQGGDFVFYRSDTRDEFDQLLEDLKDPSLSHKQRSRIGERLDELGDRRPGVKLVTHPLPPLTDQKTIRLWGENPEHIGLPDITWVHIPAGRISIKDTAFEFEDFYIAQYPITHAQFTAFVLAEDGFRNAVWFEGLSGDDAHRELFGDIIWQREVGKQTFDYENHPRENVNWYDAIAFCRWLNSKLRLPDMPLDMSLGDLRLYHGIRLPTEWEWLQSATNGAERYEWDPKRSEEDVLAEGLLAVKEGRSPMTPLATQPANTRESGLSRTTAVGMYPDGASPFGALDLAGNVWEWCLNKYDKAQDICLRGIDSRARRGGSWEKDFYFASPELRDHAFPYDRNPTMGFRIARSAKKESL